MAFAMKKDMIDDAVHKGLHKMLLAESMQHTLDKSRFGREAAKATVIDLYTYVSVVGYDNSCRIFTLLLMKNLAEFLPFY